MFSSTFKLLYEKHYECSKLYSYLLTIFFHSADIVFTFFNKSFLRTSFKIYMIDTFMYRYMDIGFKRFYSIQCLPQKRCVFFEVTIHRKKKTSKHNEKTQYNRDYPKGCDEFLKMMKVNKQSKESKQKSNKRKQRQKKLYVSLCV